MKTKTNFKNGSYFLWSQNFRTIKRLILGILIYSGMQMTLQAQDTQYSLPSWRFGIAAGANINFYSGSTQELNAELTVPAAFHKGTGVGLFIAPMLEYHRPGTLLGFMFQAGFDSRKASFKQITNPCFDCPADLSSKLRYISLEPSLRIAPFKSNFYLFAGPRLAFNIGKSFKYELGEDPEFPNQGKRPDVEGDFSDIKSSLISMQVGAGVDIPLSSRYHQTQFILSPYISLHPYFGQNPRSIETWNVTTLRAGAVIKFGRGQEVPSTAVVPVSREKEPAIKFTVHSPENIPSERRVTETFPIRNYIFFDLGSTEISDRYVLLKKNQVKDFKEDQLEVYKPKRLSGRSDRQMTVYYNILNILGDRLGANPTANIVLTGSSAEGTDDGLAMAESVKSYLVNIFEIDETRIKTEGRIKPRIPSEQVGGTKELDMLREEDRRVSVSSESQAIMMEFQSGLDAPLRPIQIAALQTAPLDSYVTFNAEGANKAFSSWSLEIRDEKGILQNFGPYTQEKVSIPGKTILGNRPQGDFNVTMVGKTKSGMTVKREAQVRMNLWTPSTAEQGLRYSLIFEFDKSNVISVYEKYLIDVVTPSIPKNGTVIIHGYTDIIGSEAINLTLSLNRANEVSRIIESALAKAGRRDVTIDIHGFGKDNALSPFSNNTPEERFYNRTVIIDILPPR
jgi:outer membrane protein OmpA-like peptidoglycan-associated protein